jgi:hypothetical protein
MSLMRRKRRAIAATSKGEFKIHVCDWLAGWLFVCLYISMTIKLPNVCEILAMMVW